MPALALCAGGDLMVRTSLPPNLSLKKLAPGSVIEGEIGPNHALAPGTRVRVVVDEVIKHKPRISKLRLLGALATSAPRPKTEYRVVARSASLIAPNGREKDVDAEVLAIVNQRRLVAKGQSLAAVPAQRGPVMILRLADQGSPVAPESPLFGAGHEIPAGAKARVMLTHNLRASDAKAGNPVEARLLEPLQLSGGAIVPAGSLFTGAVTAARGPRRLLRPASLRISFSSLRTPSGEVLPIATVLSSADVEKGAGASMDSEGGLSGGPPTKLRLAIDIGLAYAAGKIVDDLLEEGVKWSAEAIASGSVATVARYVGIGTGAVFLVLQRGRDVRLPQYTELELTFARPAVYR
ncbi:MAG: hypothetical protein R2729_20790 [Bryobacteraceae bacterium]